MRQLLGEWLVFYKQGLSVKAAFAQSLFERTTGILDATAQ
jgi:hypothetical protein